MVIYILQSLILPKLFFFFFSPPEDCSKDQHSFKTTQPIPEETLLGEASANDLAAEGSPGSLRNVPGCRCRVQGIAEPVGSH